MKKLWLVIFLLSFAVLSTGCSKLFWGKGWATGDWPMVCVGADCFDVKIADEPSEHQIWLQWVEEMGENEWMLFVFDNLGRHEFWMKDTLIPLDMVWMDESGEVVYVKEYAPPCTKEPCQLYGPAEWGPLAKYVLELNANTTRVSGIFEWEKLEILGVQ